MKRATVLLLAVVLVPAAGADAKFSSARVCGPSDCREISLGTGRTLMTITDAAFSAPLKSNPPEASPWYRVTLGPGLRHAFTFRVLPDTGYEYLPPKEQGPREGWAKLDQDAAAVYRRVTAGLAPFPVSRLVELGAVDPGSSGNGGIPVWVWVGVAAAAVTLTLSSRRWLRRSQQPQPVR